MDLSVLLNETLPNLISNTISGAAASYVSYRLGIKQAREDGNAAVLRQMIDTNNPRFSPLELAKCKNIMDIAKLAETYRKIENSSSTEFSFEWFDRFFDAASRVSDDDMRAIWAKILSEESNNRGTYSFRFIESMKLLSQYEAETFSKLAKLTLLEPDGNLYIYAPSDSQIEIYEKFGITDYDFLLMEECGLINMGVTQNHDIELDVEACNGFYNGNLFVRFYSETLSDEMVFKFESYPLTRFGQQIYNLIEDVSCKGFVLDLANNIKHSLEVDLVVAVHPILGVEDGDVIVDTDVNIL
ncbi:DUF2806 domain-containing protein [Streptococcus anginosus]|uniref:DUF2806 domain-containing protein n=1 Tax=Streptococcus anginosus TaxID=1328 RepID=UPI00300F9D75